MDCGENKGVKMAMQPKDTSPFTMRILMLSDDVYYSTVTALAKLRG